MVSTPFNFQLTRNHFNDQYISYASKQLAPYEYWTASNQKSFSLQLNFVRNFVFDLHANDSNPNFKSVRKNVSIMRHTTFLEKNSSQFHKNNSFFKKGSCLLFHFHINCFII